MSAPSAQEQQRAELLAKLLDLRSFIGSLFLVFGVIVTIDGLAAGQDEIAKAAGINISLWTGLVMIVVAAVFITWLLLAPPTVERRTDDDESGGIEEEFGA